MGTVSTSAMGNLFFEIIRLKLMAQNVAASGGSHLAASRDENRRGNVGDAVSARRLRRERMTPGIESATA
jgi:hypothetical protein